MRWSVQVGDILDIPADVLICSANVYLNLSGGVGGAFLLRYGSEMQMALHRYLAECNLRHVPRGTVVCMPSFRSPYRAVLHAVAIDAAYESSSAVVEVIVRDCLVKASAQCARVVALPALATGYGKLSIDDFIRGIQPLLIETFMPLEEVVIGVRSTDDATAIQSSLPIVK